MLKLTAAIVLFITQLSGLDKLPQILVPQFHAASIQVGKKAEIRVSFTKVNDYAIDRTLAITLKLTPVPGVRLVNLELKTSSDDPKSKDGYYVNLPILKIPLTASKTGRFEIPGKLTYYFCSEREGFCSRQIIDVKIPITVQ